MTRSAYRRELFLSLCLLSLLPGAAVHAQTTDPRGPAYVALRDASSVPLTGSTEAGGVRMVSFNIPATGFGPVDQARSFLDTYGALFGLTGPDQRLIVRRVERTPGPIQFVSFVQQYKGVPVFGGGIRVVLETSPFTGQTRIVSAGGALLPDLELEAGLDVRPSLSPQSCVSAAQSHLDRPGAEALADPKLMVHDPRLAGESPDPHLVWAATMGGGSPIQVLCDAHSGAIVFERPFANEALDLWEGLLFPNPSHTFLGDESGLNSSGQTILDAVVEWNYAHQIYNFFTGLFGWRGLTGKDNQLQLLVHGVKTMYHPDDFGEHIQIQPGYASLDVTGHEFAHGIIQHSSNLIYSKISGALNEGYADAMGVFIDNQDWLLGEDRTGAPGEIVRNFANPADNYGPWPDQPDRYSNLCTSNNQCYYDGDSGGVHTNSGILNKAHYLMATGEAFNGRPAFAGISMGRFRMGVLAFYTMRSLSSSATFQDARFMSIVVAQALAGGNWFGFVSTDVCAVRNGFASVEIGHGDFNCDGIEDNWQDPDGDFVPTSMDNCPFVWNPDQKNFDSDGVGDACDTDFDNDGRPNGTDNCFATPNWDQANNDKTAQGSCGADGLGDVCDPDDDNDGVVEFFDNCPKDCNPGQEDGNGVNGGDACDPDSDGDGAYESSGDNCPCNFNPSQADGDGDGIGDTCDLCPAAFDTPIASLGPDWQCHVPRPLQSDSDEDGIGDACDPFGFGDAALNINGFSFRPGLLHAPGGEPAFGDVSGPGGNRFRIPIPLCDPTGPADPPDVVELVFFDLDPAVEVSLLDDDGLAIDAIRPGPPASFARGLRVGPDCSRSYKLEFSLSAAFPGADGFVLSSLIPDPASDNPYVTPGMGLPPAPPIPDMDGDGLVDSADSCPSVFDPTGIDTDGDGIGDACDCVVTGPEVCNGLDDDCDGTVDNAANPGPVTSLMLNPQPLPPGGGPSAILFSWEAEPLSQGYDLVFGLLDGLVGPAGGFDTATQGCLAYNFPGTDVELHPEPKVPGQVHWFLVRGNNCTGHGTYDSGSPSQIGPRDAGINGSPMACP